MIELINTGFAVGKKILVNNISLQVDAGEFVVVMGANGAGKSTLLKMMSGALQTTTGEVLFKGKSIHQYKTEELAKQRAVLSQHYHISFPLSAREIVMMGRYPYFNNQPLPRDEEMVSDCMCRMEVNLFSDRNYQTLSGGEAQKVQMCRVLAQIGETSAINEKLLLLDEPVSHLDIKYQHQLLKEAKHLCKKNVAVLAVLHDVNLALKYADRILFMKDGILVKELNKKEVITASLLKEVFDVEAKIFDMPDGNGKFVSY
jgi:iron complex transport system ATP-binding protein